MVHEAWTASVDVPRQVRDFDDVEALPKPAAAAPTDVGRGDVAGGDRLGGGGCYSILMDPHASFGEIAAKYDRYVAALAANGLAAPVDTPMARLVAVADTDAAAEQVARAGAAWTLGADGHGVEAAPAIGWGRWRPGRALRARPIVWGSAGAGATKWPPRRGDAPPLLEIAPLSHDSFLRFTDEVLPHV